MDPRPNSIFSPFRPLSSGAQGKGKAWGAGGGEIKFTLNITPRGDVRGIEPQ
jgi:hypothetical protein